MITGIQKGYLRIFGLAQPFVRHLGNKARKILMFVSLFLLQLNFLWAGTELHAYQYRTTMLISFLLFGVFLFASLPVSLQLRRWNTVMGTLWIVFLAFMLVTIHARKGNLSTFLGLALGATSLIVVWSGRRDYDMLFSCLYNVTVCVFLVFFVLYVALTSPIDGNAKYAELFGNSNTMGQYITVVWTVFLAGMAGSYNTDNSLRKIFRFVLLGAAWAMIFLSVSYTAAFAMFISSIGWLLFEFLRNRTQWRSVLKKAGLLILTLVAALFILYLLFGSDIITKWSKVMSRIEFLKSVNANQHSFGHIDSWKMFFRYIRPFGSQLGTAVSNEEYFLLTGSAHMNLLQVAFDNGIIASVILLLFQLWSGFRSILYSWHYYAKSKYALIPMIVTIGYGVTSLFAPTLSIFHHIISLAYFFVQAPLFASDACLLLRNFWIRPNKEENPKKTLRIISSLTVRSMGGGAGGPAFVETIEGYQKDGWDVFLYSNEACNREYTDLEADHNIYIPSPIPPSWLQAPKLGWFARILNQKLFHLCVAYTLNTELIKKRKNVVLYGYEVHGVHVAVDVAEIHDLPLITRFQGTMIRTNMFTCQYRVRRYPHIQALAHPADLIVMTNDGTQGDKVLQSFNNVSPMLFLKNGLNLMERDINAMYKSFDRASFCHKIGMPEGHTMLLTVSRLVNWKRIDRSLSALPDVIKQHRNVTLVVVGEGPERLALEKLADDLGVRSQVIFTGAVAHQDVYEYMMAADIFLSLYDTSNLGNPLFEAMALGKTIITLDVGATNTVFEDEKTGILLTCETLDRLPVVIDQLIDDQAYAQRLADGASTYAHTHFYTWNTRMEIETQAANRLLCGDKL